jgi:hypothetical protein
MEVFEIEELVVWAVKNKNYKEFLNVFGVIQNIVKVYDNSFF